MAIKNTRKARDDSSKYMQVTVSIEAWKRIKLQAVALDKTMGEVVQDLAMRYLPPIK